MKNPNVEQLSEDLEVAAIKHNGYIYNIDGIEFTHPLSNLLDEMNSYKRYFIDPWTLSLFSLLHDLHQPEKIPSEWMEFLHKTSETRQNNGCGFPIDLITAIEILAKKEKDYLNSSGNLYQSFFPDGEPTMEITTLEQMIFNINQILEDPILKSKLQYNLSILIPDISPAILEDELKEASKYIMGKFNSGIVLDFGSGTGIHTQMLAGLLGDNFQVFGMERQHDSIIYGLKEMGNITNVGSYIAGDIRFTPIKGNTAEIVIMNTVINHINTQAIEESLTEALRVLKCGGILIIMPQIRNSKISDEDYNLHMTRIFIKSTSDQLTEI